MSFSSYSFATSNRALLRIIAVLVASSLVWALPVSVGAVSAAPSPRVAYGENANRSETPWFVFLRITQANQNELICGGTAISKRWILTAAHCLVDAASIAAYVNPSSFPHGASEVEIDSVTSHPSYGSPGAGYRHDIAALKVKKDMNVKPLAYAGSSEFLAANSMLDVYGYGVDENGLWPNTLQTVRIQERFGSTNGMCGIWDPKVYDNSTMICATRIKSPSQSYDACGGDSGGPLTYGTGSSRKLVGLVSWGQGRCGITEYPGVYTRISAYANWIKDETGIGSGQTSAGGSASGKLDPPKPSPARLTVAKPFTGKYKKLTYKKKLTLKIKNPGGQTGAWTIKPGAVGKTRKGNLARGKSINVSFKVKTKAKKCTTVKVLFGKKTILKFKVGLNGKKC